MSTDIQNAAGDTVVTIPGDVTVQQAWSAVMGEVTHLGKDSRNQQQGFNFRGIDAVMNLVGPVLRKHGVAVIPSTRNIDRRDFTTKNGTTMRETVVDVAYEIVGPNGDTMYGSSYGEASDAGDKSTPKAMSVAMRTFLLQSLCLPTDEPDPDLTVVDRGVGVAEQQELAATVTGLVAATDVEAVKRVEKWAGEKDYLGKQVVDAEGNSVPLLLMFQRTYERLGDTSEMERASKVLADSLGATEVKTEGATA